MRATNNAGDLERQLCDLGHMELEPLRAKWLRLYRSTPPPRLSRDLLARGIAYKLQEAAHGGLRPAARRQLRGLARSNTVKEIGRTASASLRAGATLVRTWRGQTHTVLVLADGYEHQGQRHRSLSQIAKAITGAHWSGPRFFGLNAAVAERVDEAA